MKLVIIKNVRVHWLFIVVGYTGKTSTTVRGALNQTKIVCVMELSPMYSSPVIVRYSYRPIGMTYTPVLRFRARPSLIVSFEDDYRSAYSPWDRRQSTDRRPTRPTDMAVLEILLIWQLFFGPSKASGLSFYFGYPGPSVNVKAYLRIENRNLLDRLEVPLTIVVGSSEFNAIVQGIDVE